MQRSVVRAHPALLERVTRSENRNGNRSQSRNHARLYRVQAPELPDAEVEAKLARPRRVPEVLPLVRQPYAAPGDPVMARSTRQQRRQRRAQAAGTPPLRPAPRPRPTAEEEPPKQQAEPRPERRDDVRPGTPGIRFLQESWAELKKVEWPSQQQLTSGTAVVLVACLITGIYLYGNDRLWEFV